VKKKSVLDLSKWEIYTPGTKIPLQWNGSDCGVFAYLFLLCIFGNMEFAFSQKDIPIIRQRLVLQVLDDRIDPETNIVSTILLNTTRESENGFRVSETVEEEKHLNSNDDVPPLTLAMVDAPLPSLAFEKEENIASEEEEEEETKRVKKAPLEQPKSLPESEMRPFYGILPKEWEMPDGTVLDGSLLFLNLCREAFSKPPIPLDDAIRCLLALEPNKQVFHRAVTEYIKSGQLIEHHSTMFSTSFAIASQFLIPIPPPNENDPLFPDLIRLGLAEQQSCRSITLFCTCAAYFKPEVRLELSASTTKPFTPEQLATARVLFRPLIRVPSV
jgi:hypothetical protein